MKKKVAAVLAVLLLAGAGGAYYRITHVDTFPAGSTINGVSVEKMNAEQASTALQQGMNDLSLMIDDRQVKVKTDYEVKASSIERLIQRASVDPYTWYKLRNNMTLEVEVVPTENTAKILKDSEIGKDDKKSKDAYIDLDKMKIVKEVQGNQINYKRMAKALAKKIAMYPSRHNFKFTSSDYYIKPKVYSDDESLAKELEFDKQYIAPGLTIEKPNGTLVTISNKEIAKVVKNNNGEPEYQLNAAKTLVENNASSYISDSITVATTVGKRSVTNYAAAWYADTDATAQNVIDALKGNRKAKMVMSGNDPHANVNQNHVEVNIAAQTVTLVKNGSKVFSTSVVTGNSGLHDTPTGLYAIQSMSQDVTLKGENDDGSEYASPVSFWMGFNGSYGMHDASWRSTFGGGIYQGNGSHGCVNMPYGAASRLYSEIDYGYYVVVF